MARHTSTGYKYGEQARRHLAGWGYRRLGDVCLIPDPGQANRAFDQLWSWLEGIARPTITRRDDLHDEIQAIWHELPDDAHAKRRAKWETLWWITEGYYRDGIWGARPRGEDVDGATIVEPSGGDASHFYAEEAYRTTVVAALEIHGQATLQHPDHAVAVSTRTYNLVRALAHPVLQRLPVLDQEAATHWTTYTPREPTETTHTRQLNTFPILCQAWTQSGILANHQTPVDASAEHILSDLARDLETHPGAQP